MRPLLFNASLFALVLGAAHAQPLPEDARPPSTDPSQLQQSNGVKYLNGGASEEERLRMEAQASEFPVRIELSGKAGEYIVADALTLNNRAGRTIASVANAGPVVMFNLPPGQYTAELALPGGDHARRVLQVGREPQISSWNFPQVKK